MLSERLREELTVEVVEKELTDLETAYRAHKRKLRALLAVLREEAGPDMEEANAKLIE